MHLTSLVIAALAAARLGTVLGYAVQGRRNDVRTRGLLLDIPGLPPTPELHAKSSFAKAQAAALPLTDIQADILIGMKKPQELFFFFQIANAAAFKTALKDEIIPLVTSTATILGPVAQQPKALLNVAFSASGLKTLGVTDDFNDSAFEDGQFADADNLKDDQPATNWVKGFQGTNVHGVFLIASDDAAFITESLKNVTTAFGSAITEVHRLQGAARPGDQEGHEHFGFLDGVAQPAIAGLGTPLPGQTVTDPGVFLVGETGDFNTRPAWAKDGSFLVFRQLEQFVPEFNKFLLDNPTDGSPELTGARMVGRWKSGAPIDLSPKVDDPALGADAQRNQNFDFTHPEIPGFDFDGDQTRCPFSAHIRKTHPRADLNTPSNQIIRAGIPYGPEVTGAEANTNKTSTERGLAFVSYQSSISSGFRTQQQAWANSPNFIFGKNESTPGLDPIIGQAGNGAVRDVSGVDILDPAHDISVPVFVQSRGGEYFFTPSISALSNTIAL